jgi:hypothetical protein
VNNLIKAFALTAMVSGCALMTYEKPTTVSHGIGYARASLTTGYDTTRILVSTGKMKRADRDAVVAKLDASSKLVDAAEVASQATWKATPQETAASVVEWVQTSYQIWQASDKNQRFVSDLIEVNAGGPFTPEQVQAIKDRMTAARDGAVSA